MALLSYVSINKRDMNISINFVNENNKKQWQQYDQYGHTMAICLNVFKYFMKQKV